MALPPPAAVPFIMEDTATDPATKDEVESPSKSSTNALARYEYEAGHANATQGTKILMVEWEDDATTSGVRGDWHVSWDGSTRVLPANDQSTNDLHRIYFLLPPLVPVPTSVTLTLRPHDASIAPVVWHTNPLPALFPPELGASARAAGKKGVLHTIWAKKRLQVLLKEIEAESRNNIEGIGLEIIMQEKSWIETTFGVNGKPAPISLNLTEPTLVTMKSGPASPRSPGGGRLMEKLAGLRLGTSDKDLVCSPGTPFSNPLSPESSDIAVSSFAVFKGVNPSPFATETPQPLQQAAAASRNVSAQIPPRSFVAPQNLSTLGSLTMGSLNALSGPGPVFQSRGLGVAASSSSSPGHDDDDHDEGLFALPISPRSPEIGQSPFSFASSDRLGTFKGASAA